MRLGLVMEGGSMRGMFTSGVIDVLMEKGITFDGAIGVSAGATFGCNYKSKQIGRAIRYNTKYCGDSRYGTFKNFIKTGDMYDVDFCYRELPGELDKFDTETFASNPMEFYVVGTDVETGKAVYHKCTDGLENDLEWIRASASVPMVSRIVEVDGNKLLDGGIADSIPLKYFRSIGYKRNVVILTRPADYIKERNKMLPLCKLIYRKYPGFIKAFANRHMRYNACVEYIKRLEEKEKIFVIRPEAPIDVKSAEKDPEKLRKAYEMGRATALKAIEERKLLEWMEKNK